MKKIISLFVVGILLTNGYAQEQQGNYKIRTAAFYNLENLFDTVNDTEKNDEASPIMEMEGDKEKVYWDKIEKLSSVISQIGKDKANTSPAILGVAEIENKKVLEDLAASENLKSKRYEIIHFDSPDKRGIDVALLYQPRYFKPIHFEAFNPNIYSQNRKVYTRDILLVSGYLDGELIHVIVNHWPARRGRVAGRGAPAEKPAYKMTQIIAALAWTAR